MITIETLRGTPAPARRGSAFCLAVRAPVVLSPREVVPVLMDLKLTLAPGHVAVISGCGMPRTQNFTVESAIIADNATCDELTLQVTNPTDEWITIADGDVIAAMVVLPCYGGPSVRPEVADS